MPHANDTPHHFEVVGPHHFVATFDSGHALLTDYLRNNALIDTQQGTMQTFVCIDEDAPPEQAITGYFTAFVTTNTLGPFQVKAVEIHRLARHIVRRGQGWGDVILAEALAYAKQIGEPIGARSVQLQTTPEGLRLYLRFGFEQHPWYTNYLRIKLEHIP
jgi:GNAT superfamily N-acetyltransferase